MIKEFKTSAPLVGASAASIFAGMGRFSPRICLDKEDGTGTGEDGKTEESAGADEADQTDAEAAGKKAVDDEKARLIKDVMDKKARLAKESERAKVLEKEIEAFKSIGLSLDDIKKLVAEREEGERTAAERKGDFERVKEMMATNHRKDMEKILKENEDLKGRLSQLGGTIDELTVGASFSNSRFIGEKLLLTPAKTRALFGSHFDVEDGQIVAFDKPRGSANRTRLVDGNGADMSFEAALEHLVSSDSDAATLFKSKLKPGAQSGTDEGKKKKTTDTQGLKGVEAISAGISELLAARKK